LFHLIFNGGNAMLSRRRFLSAATIGGAAVLVAPRMVFARAFTDSRFVFIIQRGAADGLNTVVPFGDPAYAGLRGDLAIDRSSAISLNGMFALHPSLVQMGGMYTKGDALFVHAVASPYRDRSHFDGQNVLESGGTTPYQVKQGWLNRLASLMPEGAVHSKERAIALSPTVPLALRGPAAVTSYAPSALPQAPDDLLVRVSQLYAGDAQLHPLWASALQARGLANDVDARQNPAGIGRLAASFLAQQDGPRIAMIETGGWDTHSGQNGRLSAQLKSLDAMVAALRDGLGSVWADTTVVVATEFGRTAAANGTGGTDHGTASAVMVLGGRVKGGRVVADWPGLAPGNLFQGRDLAPTAGLDTVIANAAGESFGLDPARVAKALFPQTKPAVAGALSGLLKT
jgi:uncharacterized protein (DUF1501 family)